MIDNEQHSNDILAQPNIYFGELSQMVTIGREEDVEDLDDDDIGIEMTNKFLSKT
jgi:hypothetical protein